MSRLYLIYQLWESLQWGKLRSYPIYQVTSRHGVKVRLKTEGLVESPSRITEILYQSGRDSIQRIRCLKTVEKIRTAQFSSRLLFRLAVSPLENREASETSENCQGWSQLSESPKQVVFKKILRGNYKISCLLKSTKLPTIARGQWCGFYLSYTSQSCRHVSYWKTGIQKLASK